MRFDSSKHQICFEPHTLGVPKVFRRRRKSVLWHKVSGDFQKIPYADDWDKRKAYIATQTAGGWREVYAWVLEEVTIDPA